MQRVEPDNLWRILRLLVMTHFELTNYGVQKPVPNFEIIFLQRHVAHLEVVQKHFSNRRHASNVFPV